MEQNEINKGNKLKLVVIAAIILVVSITGISYAYFTIQITGNEEASSMRLRTANMSLIYNDAQIVAGEYVKPGWSDTKTLTVTNEGNITVYYNIVWKDFYNEVMYDEFIISATCASSSGSCSDIETTGVPITISEVDGVKLKRNIPIAPGVTHTYTLTAEFIETGSNQNYNQNKVFYGTLNIEDGVELSDIALTTDSGASGLSAGDIVTISKGTTMNEQFYVVSTDSSKTVLLAKYNLLVGQVYEVDKVNQVYSNHYTLTSEYAGYGFQSATALGGVSGATQRIGTVPFSGINYWDSRDCYYNEATWTCGSGYAILLTEYAYGGVNYNSSSYPYVYNPTMIGILPEMNYNNSTNNGNAQNNGYGIAHYVEEYMDRLGVDGVGRLLTYEEAQFLLSLDSSIIYNGSSYWLGSTYNDRFPWVARSNDTIYNNFNFARAAIAGVRPVVVVNTSDIS